MKLTLSCLSFSIALLALSTSLSRAEENAELKTALDECAASASTEESGHPDRTAMDACMTAKGFTKPIGKRGRGGPGKDASGSANQTSASDDGQYVDKAALEAALTECRSSVSTDESGQPNRQEVDTCMEVKGFKKPEKEKRRPHPQRSGESSASTNASGSSRAKLKSAK